MSVSSVAKKLPEYALNIKQNLLSIFVNGNTSLANPQLYGVALTVGYLLGNEQLLNAIRAEAKLHLEEVDAKACKIAAVMMSMNNTYYRFAHYTCDPELINMPLELYMDSIFNIEVTKSDFEIYCLAASILNGCQYCVNIHKKKLTDDGIAMTTIRDIGRVVSVLKATSEAIGIETMRSYDFIARGASFD